MLWLSKKWILSSFILLINLGCINKNVADDAIMLSVINQLNTSEDFYQSREYNSCVVSADTTNGRLSVCFQLGEADCSLNFFNTISTDSILQKRKDDLTFISLNYTNCSSSVGTLGAKYNAMSIPASIVLQDYFKINGNIDAKMISFTNVESCGSVGLLVSKYVPVNFSSLLDSSGLQSIDGLESELALITTTTNACINDLSFQPAFLPTIQSLRDGSIQRGIVCSHTAIPGYQICPWLE